GSLTYDLQLVDDTTQQPILMQLVAIDGASVDVPPINSGSAVRFSQIRAPSRFTPTPCPEAMTGAVLSSVPICVTHLVMMPSSRAEVRIVYRDALGNVQNPPPRGDSHTEAAGADDGAGRRFLAGNQSGQRKFWLDVRCGPTTARHGQTCPPS